MKSSCSLWPIYRALSILFSYPSKHLAEYLEQLKPAIMEQDCGGLSPRLVEIIDMYINALRSGEEEVQAEYTSMFINSYPDLPAPPYASYYLEGALMGFSTLNVSKIYMDSGFESQSELPDHIAVELEFLSILSYENRVEEEKKFLCTHFLKWTPRFSKRVADHGSQLYGVLSEFLLSLTKLLAERC